MRMAPSVLSVGLFEVTDGFSDVLCISIRACVSWQIRPYSGTLRAMSESAPAKKTVVSTEVSDEKCEVSQGASPVDKTADKNSASVTLETGGPTGPEPTRYGDWERKGRCIDF